jgi:hypothetical protein
MQFHGLHALAAAAEALERAAAHASPDLNTQRERRRLAVHLRRFEEMRRPRRTPPPPAPLVGRILWKEFNDPHGRPRLYQGHVASVSRAAKGRPYDFGAAGTATVKYSVQYDDGDSEDMTRAELLKHLVD